MFGKLSKYFLKPVVPIIRLSGEIDTSSTYLVAKSLERISPARSKAVGFVIDSKGGSPVQGDIILKAVKDFCKEHHLPLYTFAENHALSTGYWVLCAGDKVYADTSSAVGSISANLTHLQINNIYENNKINVRTWGSDDKKIIPSPWYEVKDVHREAIQKWTDDVREKFISHVEKYRKSKLTVPEGQRNEKLYEGKTWTGQEVLNYGLVDGLGTYASVFYRDFPECRIVDVSEKKTLVKYQERGRELIKLFTSRALPWIIAYFAIKFTIKLWLVLLVLSKKDSSDRAERKEAERLDEIQKQL